MKNPSSKLTRIRLDLEEYDFVVEYIAGKEKYIADALSRLDMNDLMTLTIGINPKICISTRSMNKRIISNKEEVIKQEKPKLNVYDALYKYEVKKHVRLTFIPPKLGLRKGKTICSLINIKDTIVNEEIDLGQLFSRLTISYLNIFI